jgi:hypothetical protein
MAFQDSMHGWGFTAIMSIAPIDVDEERYQELEKSGELALRVNLAQGIDNDKAF